MTRARPGLALLLTAVLSGCAGTTAPTAPTDASEEEFCEVQSTLFADIDLSGDGPAPTSDEIAKSLQDWADAVEEVGTPAGMSDDARAGFEGVVELARQADAEDFDEDGSPGGIPEELSAEEEEQAQAFTAYVGETCGAGGTQSGLPEVPELSE
jgi:hypothetical protein